MSQSPLEQGCPDFRRSPFTRRDVLDHYRTYYHPKNLLVTACGEIDHDQLVNLSEHYFSKQKATKRTSKFNEATVPNQKTRMKFVKKDTEQTHFVIGFHGLRRRDPNRFTLSLLNVVLGANMSSRLFEEVREQRGLAYEIRSGMSYFEDTGAIAISAGVEPKKGPLATKVIMRELNKLKSELIGPAELKRAKEYYKGQLVLGLEDALDHMLWFGEQALFSSKIFTVDEIRRKIDAITAEDLRKMSRRIFRKQDVHLTLIGPLKSQNEEKMRKACVLP